ncbi:MAG: SIMPL domain-containing protein [Chloroflexi bacterium]|nr:SIMPL domain-containing protein [Chloroflexota bacterium]
MSSRSVTLPLPSARLGLLAAGTLAGLLVGANLAPTLGPRPALAQETEREPDRTISVSGTGRVSIVPDVVDIRLGVQVTKPKVKDARATAAAQMTRVVAALKAAGIADKDIQTANLSLQPVYDYSNSGAAPRLVGYQLTNTVSATVRDLDKVSEAVDGAMAAGANTLDSLSFRVDDPAGAEAQARDAAMADAKAKADALAKAAGVSIVGVASIAETSSPAPVPYEYAGREAFDAAAAPTPILAGTSEVSVSVSVVYLLG